MNTVSIFQDYMGEEITKKCIERLMHGPEEHLGEFVQRLTSYYFDWLENEEAKAVRATADSKTALMSGYEHTYYCIDPLDHRRNWRERLDVYKKYLLYFPHCSAPDPVAEFLWPHITAALVVGGFGPSEEFKNNFQNALLLLAELAPALLKKDIILMPRLFAGDYEHINRAVNLELKAIGQDSEYWEPLYRVAAEHATDRGGARSVVAYTKRECQLCSRVELTPIAGHELIYSILKQEYDHSIRLLRTANSEHRIAQTLLRYDVPGLEKASFEEVIALRNNEDAFYDWRREFGKVLDQAQSEQTTDNEQFEIEFRAAADAILVPCIKELEKATASSVLEKFLVPATLSLGAGAAAFYVAGLEAFPATAAAAAALGGPANWVLDKVIKRFNKGGRKATILREFYGYLLEKKN